MSEKRRSSNITEGVARAPNRSMYYAMGYVKSDFDKPMIGIANGHSTITPPATRDCRRLPMRRSRPFAQQAAIPRSSVRPPFPTACRWVPKA